MGFLHERKHLAAGQVVRLDCDTQCNFMLTDDANFAAYRRGGAFRYHGGHYKRFPAAIRVPRTGMWNITIDLGGASANIRCGLTVVG